MLKNIWKELRKRKPLFILAPMEEVTDTVFRRVIMESGKPDLFFTEFTSCEGVQSAGQAKVIHRLRYEESERPIIAQVWGITPEDYYKTTLLIKDLGFDGIDINMGCPVKKIIKQGACSALIKNPPLARDIINAVKEAAGSMPVSIKTRIGFNKIQTEEWIGFLLESCQPAALTIHGRTVKEESKPPNHWDQIGLAVSLRDTIQKELPEEEKTLIIGNGDILSYQEGLEKIQENNLDGVMIGRGIFHNPWLFDHSRAKKSITVADRIDLLKFHLKLWDNTWKNEKNYQSLKRFFKIYIQEFPGASDLRHHLMETLSTQQALQILGAFEYE